MWDNFFEVILGMCLFGLLTIAIAAPTIHFTTTTAWERKGCFYEITLYGSDKIYEASRYLVKENSIVFWDTEGNRTKAGDFVTVLTKCKGAK